MPAKTQSPSNSPADILDLVYKRVLANLNESFLNGQFAALVEFVCRCSNLAGTRFLMACLLAKLSHPELDIRKPYTEIGGTGVYSGRYYDETYVGPFAFKHELPVNATTSFLTPAFRTNKTSIAPGVQLVGRPRQLYVNVVELITLVHKDIVAAESILAEIVRWLLLIREERQQRVSTLLAALAPSQNDSSLPAESIITLIVQHLALPKSARLPVIMVAAAYQAAQKHLGERPLPLQGHNAADRQTGALGDLEIILEDENRVVTVYEMKAKRITPTDIEIALQKIAEMNYKIDNYIFITTDKIDDDVQEYSASLYALTGIEFVILDCIGFLRHFLHLFYRARMTFLEAYQALVISEPDSAINPSLKEAFLSLRVATETGVSQLIQGEEE